MTAPHVWKSRGGRGFGSAPFLIAGIVNLTPDSFSDGGMYTDPEKAMARCRSVAMEGAAIIDLGGESTRPGSAPAGVEEELARLMPVVSFCLAMRDLAKDAGIHVSVDTWRASVAKTVLEAGVDIINDISGASLDPAMAEVVGSYKPGYVLMHTSAPPQVMHKHTDYAAEGSVIEAVLRFFEKSMAELVRAGLPEENIILDPGIGFGKTAEQNLELLRAIDIFHSLGRPLYFGVSRKRMFGELLGLDVASRDAVTQVLTALIAARGVYVHRVHDVAGAAAALKLMVMTGGEEISRH